VPYADKTLTCVDCGAEFTFTAGEQEFHESKGFTNEPRRCPNCRRARKGDAAGGPRPAREMFTVPCASCGKDAKVPFEPRGDRPVYCSDCFQPQPRSSSGGGGGQQSSGSGFGGGRPASGGGFGGGGAGGFGGDLGGGARGGFDGGGGRRGGDRDRDRDRDRNRDRDRRW
jgi:CxxC-x17-CxxC domain-containing protein